MVSNPDSFERPNNLYIFVTRENRKGYSSLGEEQIEMALGRDEMGSQRNR